jgi:hypothetical protein
MAKTQSPRRPGLYCEPLEDRLTPDATSYVTSLYTNVLNRAPDADGLAFYVQEIQNGMTNLRVAQQIWGSPEHRGLQVDSFYQMFLHRAADADGRAFWVNQLMSGVGERTVAAEFLSSAEYLNAHNTPDAYVIGLYSNVLGRTPSLSELAFWDNALATFGSTVVATDIVFSNEAASDIVTSDYLKYLNRAPDANGLVFWVAQLQSGGSPMTVATGILGSAEYAASH